MFNLATGLADRKTAKLKRLLLLEPAPHVRAHAADKNGRGGRVISLDGWQFTGISKTNHMPRPQAAPNRKTKK